MSAPRTNIETEKRRHRGPLIGMALVVVFGLALLTWWLMEQVGNAENPGTPTTGETAAEMPGTDTPPPVPPAQLAD